MSAKTLTDFINKELNKGTTISRPPKNHWIITSEDRLFRRLSEHKEALSASKSWISHFFALFAYSLSLATGWNQLGEILRTLFLAAAFATSIFLAISFTSYIRNHKRANIDNLIKFIQSENLIADDKSLKELL